MAGVFHHGLRHHAHILDIAHASNRPGAARGPVHTARVQFDDTFFVGQAAISYGIVVGIVLRPFDNADCRIQRVAPALKECISIFDVGMAVVGGDDDWALRGIRRRLRLARGSEGFRNCGRRSHSGGDGPHN